MDVNIESTPVPLKKNIIKPVEKTYKHLNEIFTNNLVDKFKTPIILIQPNITLKLYKN